MLIFIRGVCIQDLLRARLQAESQRMSIASGDSNCNMKRRAHRDYILFRTLKVNGLYHSYVGYIYIIYILHSMSKFNSNPYLRIVWKTHIFGYFNRPTSYIHFNFNALTSRRCHLVLYFSLPKQIQLKSPQR